MRHHEIGQMFRQVFNGQPNILTRNIQSYHQKGNLLFELSWGKNIGERGRLYGVTVITKQGKKTNLSMAFSSEADAKKYIKSFSAKHDKEGLTFKVQ